MKLSWMQILTGAFALACAVAGATFSLTKYAHQAEITAYQLKAQIQDRRIVTLERQLDQIKEVLQTDSRPQPSSSNPPGGDLEVRIISPTSRVAQYADVRFALEGALPEGYKPLLMVRDPLGAWWSWGSADALIFHGIQFGTDADRGRVFEIEILISDEQVPKNEPRRSLPAFIASASATVERE